MIRLSDQRNLPVRKRPIVYSLASMLKTRTLDYCIQNCKSKPCNCYGIEMSTIFPFIGIKKCLDTFIGLKRQISEVCLP